MCVCVCVCVQIQQWVLHVCSWMCFSQVPIAIGGPGLPKGVRLRKDLPNAGLANVAATFINFHGFESPKDYEPTLIEVID